MSLGALFPSHRALFGRDAPRTIGLTFNQQIAEIKAALA
jgi:hypothetical protein